MSNPLKEEHSEKADIIEMKKKLDARTGSETKFSPSENQVITLRHALNILNHLDVLEVLSLNKYKVNSTIKRAKELEKALIHDFILGKLTIKLYEDLREKAFNPELNVSDGFFVSFDEYELNVNEALFSKYIREWNESLSEENSFDSSIELLHFRNNIGKVLVTRNSEKFAYDKRSMFSTKFVDESKVLVEIDFNANIVYFQTSNTTKYRTIKTVVKLFLSNLFDEEKFRLLPPKMSQKLNFNFSEENNAATVHNNISPNTIKLLDLLLELEDSKSNFNELVCVDISFDHEDSKKENLKSKIDRQGFGGEDLLSKGDIKQHITNNRGILQIVFKLTYTEELPENKIRKHVMLAGIDNDTSNHIRIYIQNSNLDLKRVVNKAYVDLKDIFIKNTSSSSLRNEEKIKLLLGL
ncbi:hypothetical protein ACRBU7_11025 [Priestia aryabhattai]|uniref:hypothetical protein n=1 Tax=Priestia aryabhattai TaxID=412384 RepID=UPI003D7FAC35